MYGAARGKSNALKLILRITLHAAMIKKTYLATHKNPFYLPSILACIVYPINWLHTYLPTRTLRSIPNCSSYYATSGSSPPDRASCGH